VSRIPAAVTIAPRGKAFKVVRLDHVVGGRVLPMFTPGAWQARADADAAAKRIDERLRPTVVLIDIKAQEVTQ
jgi:hypothetical protein